MSREQHNFRIASSNGTVEISKRAGRCHVYAATELVYPRGMPLLESRVSKARVKMTPVSWTWIRQTFLEVERSRLQDGAGTSHASLTIPSTS